MFQKSQVIILTEKHIMPLMTISSIIANTTSSNFQTTSQDLDVVPITGISTITKERSQPTAIETTIKRETTVETTEIGTSEPETTTTQQETSMLPKCVCTCKIVTYNLSRFTLEENIKRLIENTVIDKKGTSAYKNMKISAIDGRVSSRAIGWIGIVCICVPFICIICTDVTNWTKTKQKH